MWSGEGTQRLIPVLLDDAPLPPFVANRLYADFRHLDAPAQYEARFAELLKAVQGVPVGERPQRDHQAALTIHEELGDRAGIAASYHQLGALRTEQGRSADGVPYCIRSLASQTTRAFAVPGSATTHAEHHFGKAGNTGASGGLTIPGRWHCRDTADSAHLDVISVLNGTVQSYCWDRVPITPGRVCISGGVRREWQAAGAG